MNKRFYIFSVLVIFLLSCESIIAPTPTATLPPPTSTSTPPPTPTPLPTEVESIPTAPGCISPEPAQADIDRALAFTGEAFSASTWKRTYSVAENRVAVTWLDSQYGALAYLEALVYPCGYDEPDIDTYFSDENWKTIFANYESYEPVAECRADTGLRLYQFTTQNQGAEYAVNYWAQNDTDTRLITMMIVFPTAEKSVLGDYSTQLFPDLPNCSE